jgi:hypothetical protein
MSARHSSATFAASSRGYDRLSSTPSLPLYIDSRGFFTRFCPRFANFVFIGLPLYIDSLGLCRSLLRSIVA